MAVYEIQYEIPAASIVGADAIAEFHLKNNSDAAICDLDDPAMLDCMKFIYDFTTSGLWGGERVIRHRFDPPILITKSKIFLGFIQTVAGAKTGIIRIGYVPVKISGAEMLANMMDEY